ncbi:4Fe-4S binding protein [Bacillus sp. DNRA2]|uniref:4Fe-4S binding protein n=1 Tax=Bacillus sp. DNRA2 TaxID=2723053 RepID=UPI002006E2D7|nr:4Fe-4S binding protein [Bacillus sp. DNRA2]
MSLIFKWLESLSIDLTITDRCSRQVSPKSTCTTCLEHCDVEALSLMNNKIVIDASRCDSCGECITSCPVSAVKGNVPNRTVKNGLLYYEPHYCPTVKELLVFKKRGVKGIAVPSGWDDSQWEKCVAEANQWLAKLSMEPLIIEEAAAVADPVMSRRELFLSARKKSEHVAKELAPAVWRQNPNAWSLPHHFKDVQFYEVSLDMEKCSLCQGCFKLCQQDVFTLGEGELVIDHQKCTNCRLCVDVCPEDAVAVMEKVGVKSVATVVAIEEHVCGRCKQSYVAFGDDCDDGVCQVCARIPSDWLMP